MFFCSNACADVLQAPLLKVMTPEVWNHRCQGTNCRPAVGDAVAGDNYLTSRRTWLMNRQTVFSIVGGKLHSQCRVS